MVCSDPGHTAVVAVGAVHIRCPERRALVLPVVPVVDEAKSVVLYLELTSTG